MAKRVIPDFFIRKIFKEANLSKNNKVIIHGKTLQMSLLPKRTNNMERIPTIGQRESEAKEVQKVWKEVHSQGEK
jgi:hypothetical protein